MTSFSFTLLAVVNSCGGATDDITVTLGGSETVTETTTINANFGIDFEGINIGGGASESTSTSTTMSKAIEFSIPPGRQAVYVAGVRHKSETGNVQVNYGSKQKGHFIVSSSFDSHSEVWHAADWRGLTVVHRHDRHEAHACP